MAFGTAFLQSLFPSGLASILLHNPAHPVAVECLVVGDAVFQREVGHGSQFLQTVEHLLLQRVWHSVPMLHILQCINQFVIKCLTILELLVEIRELQENLPEMRIHHLPAFTVGNHCVRTKLFFQSRLAEVHQEDTVHGREFVPGPIVFLRLTQQEIVLFRLRLSGLQLTFLSPLLAQVLHLPPDSPAHVKQRPVQEIAVETVLHLHDDVFTRLSQAVQVVDNPRIRHAVRVVFLVQKNQVRNTVLTCQQLVQQRDKQLLAGWLPEDNLESDVGKRIHKVAAS